jgi:hypothetical protein
MAFIKACIVLAPGSVVAAAALLSRESLWKTVMMASRSGEARGVPAHTAMVGLGLLGVIYALLGTSFARDMLGSGRVRQPVSEQEMGCAVVLARGLCLLAFYGVALRLWWV